MHVYCKVGKTQLKNGHPTLSVPSDVSTTVVGINELPMVITNLGYRHNWWLSRKYVTHSPALLFTCLLVEVSPFWSESSSLSEDSSKSSCDSGANFVSSEKSKRKFVSDNESIHFFLNKIE